jgi:Domain of unknown function (DUF4328)
MPKSDQSAHSFSSLSSLTRLVTVLLALCIVIDLIAIGVGYSQSALLSATMREQTTADEALIANDNRQQVIAILQIAAYFITGVFFLIWIYRAHRNLPELGVRRPRYSPAWAVGWFFVPILNLYRPYDMVKELWKESNPDVGISDAFFMQHSSTQVQYSSKSSLIGLWWGLWIGSYVAARAYSFLLSQPNPEDQLVAATWVGMISDGLSIAAAVSITCIVRDLNARQEEKHRRHTLDDELVP